MNIKRKAVEVKLSDGETTVTVHAPTMEQFADYLNSFPVIAKIGQAFQSVQAIGDGVINPTSVHIDKATMDEFYPLLAGLSDITVEDFKQLPVVDGMSIMFAYVQLLAPETLNPTKAAEPSPAAPPQN